MKNIMDVLTPKPPASHKPAAVHFGTPVVVTVKKAKTLMTKGINRTISSIK